MDSSKQVFLLKVLNLKNIFIIIWKSSGSGFAPRPNVLYILMKIMSNASGPKRKATNLSISKQIVDQKD